MINGTMKLLSLAILLLIASGSHAFIKTKGMHFVNEDGATIIFRGFNLQAKDPIKPRRAL